MTIGITYVLVGVANYLAGPMLKSLVLPPYLSGYVDIGFRMVPVHRPVLIASAALITFGLWYLIEKRDFGIRLRAAVDDSTMAATLGVRTEFIYSTSFAISVGLAAFGG